MLSVIIVSFNGRKYLTDCLDSVLRHSPDAEVIVVDNASRDGSAEEVRTRFPTVRLFELHQNAGFAAANNVGLAAAKGDIVVLLNPDTLVEDDSLDRCADWLREHPAVGALSPQLRCPDGSLQQAQYAEPSLGDLVRVATRRKPESGLKQQWLAGTALFLRREAIDSVGGQLDDGFFVYWEDADLSARIRAAGWQLAVLPDAHVVHFGGASGGGADADRRPDLFAWYSFGRMRWFSRHRPASETLGLWCLETLDVGRKCIRGVLHPSRRRIEWAQARALSAVLFGRILGRMPRRPV